MYLMTFVNCYPCFTGLGTKVQQKVRASWISTQDQDLLGVLISFVIRQSIITEKPKSKSITDVQR